MRTAVVLAAGGERVVGWETGVLAGLADAGLDLRGANRILGTSAGAWVGARLAAGIDPRDEARRISRAPSRPAPPGAAQLSSRLAGMWDEGGPAVRTRRRIGALAVEHSPGEAEAFVDRVARTLPDGPWPAALRTVAIDTATGERLVLGPEPELARAVAASRAIPFLRPPVPVGGRRLMDGALGSATNADVLAAECPDLVVVITATPAGRQDDVLGRLWQHALETELELLRQAGCAVVPIQAGAADVAAMGPDPMSAATAPLAVAAGRRAGRAALASRQRSLAA